MSDDAQRDAPAAPAPPAGPGESSRYQVVQTEEAERCLTCSNAANLRLFLKRGLSVDKQARRRYPRQTIFLDGVYEGPPFLDNKNRQYSLDHHSGCVRPFTLATCEQAAVILLEGLPLAEGTWGLYINDPDLDALLAAWVLMSHAQMLGDDKQLLRAAMPLLRVEGVIDAHGLNHSLLTALPADAYNAHKGLIDELFERERQFKEAGEWETMDWYPYAIEVFDRLDRMFLTDAYLHELLAVQELGSVALAGGSRTAILCRCRRGIYEAEMSLKERYGKQLGVIVLDRGSGHYTLRQVDTFLLNDLRDVYRELNARDPQARPREGNQWGGSANIGGSPRSTGSGLSGAEILQALKTCYAHVSFWRRLWYTILGQ